MNKNKDEFSEEVYKAIVKKIEFNEEKEILLIEIEDSERRFDKICFIERRDGFCNKLYNPKKIFYDIYRKANRIEVRINLYNDAYKYLSGKVWDVYTYNEDNKRFYNCEMMQMDDFNMEYIYNDMFEKHLKLFKNSASRLSLFIKDKINFILVDNISEDGKSILKLQKELPVELEKNNCIRFKKRIHRFINLYSSYIDIPITDSTIVIEPEYFNEKEIVHGDVFEAFLVLFKDTDSEYEIPVRINNNDNCYININRALKYKKFMSSKNILSLFFNNNNVLELKDIQIEDDNELIFDFDCIDNIIIKSLEIIPYINSNYFHKGHEFNNFYIQNNKLHVDLDELYKYIKILNNNKFIIKLLVLIDGMAEEIIIRHSNKEKNIEIKSELFGIITEQGKSSECIFCIRKICKLAILGSCYSRAAFSSSGYFNPDYKEKYNVVFTQFHSSLISLMDNRKRSFKEQYFNDLNQTNKEYLRIDFEKDFFSQLKKSNPDYLIIDFYVDGEKGIIIFPEDETVVTGNLNVEYSQLMFNLPEGVRVINSRNVDEYIPIWCKAAQRFAREITKYIPEDRIIINYIKVAESYVNVNGEKIKYEKESDIIKTSNILLDWMNDYLKLLLPKSKVVDSRKINYIGYEKHPVGNTPNHFQSEYYKEFIKLVDNIVF